MGNCLSRGRQETRSQDDNVTSTTPPNSNPTDGILMEEQEQQSSPGTIHNQLADPHPGPSKLVQQPSTSQNTSSDNCTSSCSSRWQNQNLENKPKENQPSEEKNKELDKKSETNSSKSGSKVDLADIDIDSSEDNEDSGNESLYEDEDVEFAMEREEGGGSKKNHEEDYPFCVLTSEDTVQHMVDSIRDANHVLQLPITTMRMLLNHYKWDKEKLLESYYDGNPEKILNDARVPSTARTPTIAQAPSGEEDCGICYMQKPSTMLYSLDCGHRFCETCWSKYLATKIMDEGMGQTIICAAHNCSILVDDATVMKLVKDEKVKFKYQHLITNSFVQCNKLLRWCPSPDCTYAIRVQWVDWRWRPVTCRCGHVSCFKCGQGWHDPVNCKLMNKWEASRIVDHVATSNWISANTKECPKCSVPIQKDGGCNHVLCRNENCRADFCWVCLELWEGHGTSWYQCNRFDEAKDKAAEETKTNKYDSPFTERFLFYCNRYMNHMQSLQFEKNLYVSVEDKMEEMQQHDLHFLHQAVDILCECRRLLAYSYVFAYYLVQTNQSCIFEDNQRDMESATEKLSEYLERDITSHNLTDIKQKVTDKSHYLRSRRQVLLEHVYEGYEKDWWLYNES